MVDVIAQRDRELGNFVPTPAEVLFKFVDGTGEPTRLCAWQEKRASLVGGW